MRDVVTKKRRLWLAGRTPGTMSMFDGIYCVWNAYFIVVPVDFITMTSQWASWRLKSPAIRRFNQQFVQVSKKTSKSALPAFMRKSIGDRWFPSQEEPIMRNMMTSSNGNIFRVTGPLCGEFTGPRWIPHTKASDAELWCLLWSAPE